MLTKIRIRNFKQFEDSGDIELGQTVVFVGPNNSGKTTVLQALALWELGLRHGLEEKKNAKQRRGVLINKEELTNIPTRELNHLWRNLRWRGSKTETGYQKEIDIQIDVQGITAKKEWNCNLRFYVSNRESFYCAPVGNTTIPQEVSNIRMALLPPMSGLIADEPLLQPGRINVLVGQGQTGQILRNVCYSLYETNAQNGHWNNFTQDILKLFNITLLEPEFIPARGEIRMSYKSAHGATLDLSSSGRGMHQTMLLLAYMYANPSAVLLVDEPDAHLEIIRQREIYRLLKEVAKRQDVQLIITTHSEVVMEEADGQDIAIALVGTPHRIDQRNKSQVEKALKLIPAVDYYLAESKGWVLYLEGSTDLAILQKFAELLNHPAQNVFPNSYVHYLNNNEPRDADKYFFGLREAKKDLVGFALFDRISSNKINSEKGLTKACWRKREIENYLCMPDTLLAYADQNQAIMQDEIDGLVNALKTLKKPSPWSGELKVSDEFLNVLFENYYEKLGLPNLMRKTNFHVLAQYVPSDKIDIEVTEKLDAIVEVAKRAKPRED